MAPDLPAELTLSAPEALAPSLTLERHDDRLVLRAEAALTGMATRWFHDPAVHVPIPVAALGPGTRLTGFSYAQFAWPVTGGADVRFDFNPAENVNALPAVLPLLAAAPDGGVLLMAPLDSWHDQVIGVVQGDDGVSELRWGWHGDLDEVPAGFTSTLGLYRGATAAEVLDRWGSEIRERAGTARPDLEHSPALSRLSYWTDNGAAYWYRTEPGLDLPTTLERKLDELDELGVQVGAVELDSWFYPHEISRPVAEVGYLEEVPPTGMLVWEPRPDVLPDGIEDLAHRLGDRPLILHSRHISPASPYVDDGWWVDFTAQPSDPSFFRRWFDDAARWGASVIEQDWMVMAWFGVWDLRRIPGRAADWQRALDRSASATGIDLIWCMATPADLMASVELSRVAAVRTCDDYRYARDPARLWHWYLTVNRLAGALDLATFKDCFFSAATAPTTPAGGSAARPDTVSKTGAETGADTGEVPFGVDPHAEVEALLAAFSAGPAGIGDRLGHTDPELVARLCRPDGLLVQPDVPLGISDDGLFRRWDEPDGLCWATSRTGPWRYVVALHTATDPDPITDRFELDGEYLIYDWRTGSAAPGSVITATADHRGWALFVCCPLESDPDGRPGQRRALIGDPDRFATMGRRRVAVADDGARLLGAPGEEPEPPLWWREGVSPPLERR